MEPQKNPELRPEILFLYELVRQLVDGKIRVPRFQRTFVWRPDQMLDLLDSINRQYPIGSLLAWETDSPIVSLGSVGPLVMGTDDSASSLYLLDGHQRLTTLAGALVSPDDRALEPDADAWKWNIFYNAKDEAFEHLPMDSIPGAHQFAMSKLADTLEFIRESQRLIELDAVNGPRYVERVQEVARTFQNYKIPVIQIRQTGLTEAVEIFARLNSKGQAMTADQMVSALLYREGDENQFDLAREISITMEMLEGRGFGDLDRTLVLRALLAAVGEDIYRTDWTRINRNRREDLLEKMREAIPGVNASLQVAVDFLASQGVHNERLIPYGMQLIVISSFFFAEPEPSPAQLTLLRRWFWVTSFSTWFGSANPSRVNLLVRDFMDNVAKNKTRPALTTLDLATPAVAIPTSFDMRGARTKSMLLVLFSLRPRDSAGQPIPDPDGLVQRYGPQSLGYIATNSGSPELGRSPANRILLSDPSDRRQAKFWLNIADVHQREAVWSSHAIPPTAFAAFHAGNFQEFLSLRLDEIRRLELEFMQARDVRPPLGDSRLALDSDLDPSRSE